MNDNMVQLFAKTRLITIVARNGRSMWAAIGQIGLAAVGKHQSVPQCVPQCGAPHNNITTLGLVFKPRVMLEDSSKVKALQARATLCLGPIVSVPVSVSQYRRPGLKIPVSVSH
jgi:hypothetical protein